MISHPAVNFDKGERDKWRQPHVEVTCPNLTCGKIRFAQKSYVIRSIKEGTFTGLCRKCNATMRYGPKNPGWKGGRKINGKGYVQVAIQPDHQFYSMSTADSRVFEHRLVMAKYLCRPLRSDEVVHHIDGDKTNNSLANLFLTTVAKHTRIHKRHVGQKVNLSEYVKITLRPGDRYFCMATTDGVVYEHRLVVALVEGRVLRTDECVHHVDGNRANNAIENLFLTTRAGHPTIHAHADALARKKEA